MDLLQQHRARRKHKNSRHGCAACKTRKIKCDETLPQCENCARKDLSCPYLTLTPFEAHLIAKAHASRGAAGSTESQGILPNLPTFSHYPTTHQIDLQRNRYKSPASTSSSSGSGSGMLSDPSTATPATTAGSNGAASVAALTAMLGPSTALNESIYQASDLEHILFSNGPISRAQLENVREITPPPGYVPAKSNFDQNAAAADADAVSAVLSQSRLSPKTIDVDRSFTINRKLEYTQRVQQFQKTTDILSALHTMDFTTLFTKYGVFDLDSEIQKNFYKVIVMCAPFSKLTAKSLLLYAADYYKNTLIRQPILENVNYNAKIGITCSLENFSIEEIGDITNVIKNYLDKYDLFDESLVEILIAAFVALNYCLVYHFKSGTSTEMSFEDGQNSVSKFGIFNAGLFSISMDKSEFIQRMSGVIVISKHLVWNLKTILKPSLKWNLIDEMKRKIDKLSVKIPYSNTHFKNLKYFLEKHVPLLKVKKYNCDNFLGVNEENGYVIRLMNDFYQILPYNLSNLVPDCSLIDDEMIVTYLAYIATANLLTNLLPGALGFATNDFSGRGWGLFPFNKTETLMKLFNQMTNLYYKDTVIYMIRIITILKIREDKYKKFFTNTNFAELTDENLGIDTFERVRKLKQIRDNGVMIENTIKSFRIDSKGEFLEIWNLPQEPEEASKISSYQFAKRINSALPTIEDRIENFAKSNNGLFIEDYHLETDPMRALKQMVSVAAKSSKETPEMMAMAWKMAAHIRMHNA